LNAIEVNIKKGLPYITVDINGESVRIERIQDTSHKLKNSYTKTSRPAPPFTIQPFEPIKGIKTISELDVIDFISNEVNNNTGILIKNIIKIPVCSLKLSIISLYISGVT